MFFPMFFLCLSQFFPFFFIFFQAFSPSFSSTGPHRWGPHGRCAAAAIAHGRRAALHREAHLAVPRDLRGWILHDIDIQWIGLRENLQETMFFTIKYMGFL